MLTFLICVWAMKRLFFPELNLMGCLTSLVSKIIGAVLGILILIVIIQFMLS